MTPPKTSIAVLGLGAMGSRMARRLLEAGHDVRVWNRSPEPAEQLAAAGATRASTPREAAEGAAFVLSMIFDDEGSRHVWLDEATGAINGLGAGSLAIESGTVTRDWVLELNEAIVARGAELIDAPVTGTRPQAENGQLIFMLGGSKAAVERAKPVLACLGTIFHHIGAIGQGSIFKLAVNTLFAAQLASIAELLEFLKRAGIEQTAAAAALETFPIIGPAVAGNAKMMAAGVTAPLAPIDLVRKDLGYSIAAAKGLGLDLPSAMRTREVFDAASQKGLGAENVTALIKLFE